MKTNLTALIIIISCVWATIEIRAAVQPEIEEIAVIERERVFICPCAKPFGQGQDHLDCHDKAQGRAAFDGDRQTP